MRHIVTFKSHSFDSMDSDSVGTDIARHHSPLLTTASSGGPCIKHPFVPRDTNHSIYSIHHPFAMTL